eukprot:230576-Chlamydomonas_euryale.AAC.1
MSAPAAPLPDSAFSTEATFAPGARQPVRHTTPPTQKEKHSLNTLPCRSPPSHTSQHKPFPCCVSLCRYVGIDALAGIVKINPRYAQVWKCGIGRPCAKERRRGRGGVAGEAATRGISVGSLHAGRRHRHRRLHQASLNAWQCHAAVTQTEIVVCRCRCPLASTRRCHTMFATMIAT